MVHLFGLFLSHTKTLITLQESKMQSEFIVQLSCVETYSTCTGLYGDYREMYLDHHKLQTELNYIEEEQAKADAIFLFIFNFIFIQQFDVNIFLHLFSGT